MTGAGLFGTDGIRDVAGRGHLRPESIFRIGSALGAILLARTGTTESLAVLVGRDPRTSGPMILEAIASGIASRGLDVSDAGILPTPALARLTACNPFAAGVMISASHNPPEDNGIKFFGPDGAKIAAGFEDEIERRVHEIERSPDPVPPESIKGRMTPRPDLLADYRKELTQVRFANLDLGGLGLAIDCAHGAGYEIGPHVLRDLGATVTAIGCEPTGENINQGFGALHPERLAEAVLRSGGSGGMSLDGDGDRVILVDENGTVRDGDDMLLILATRLQQEGKLDNRTVVATVMSNIGLEIELGRRGIRLVRTPVGDKHVADAMRAGGFCLGGEQSGHIILRHQGGLYGDGLAAALAVLRVMRASNASLSVLASGLRKYPQVLVNVRVLSKPPFDELPGVMDEVRRVEGAIAGSGRVLLRYSGTESMARVMIEGPDHDQIRSMADGIASKIVEAAGE